MGASVSRVNEQQPAPVSDTSSSEPPPGSFDDEYLPTHSPTAPPPTQSHSQTAAKTTATATSSATTTTTSTTSSTVASTGTVSGSNNLTNTEFVWNCSPAHSVFITGAWDEWREKTALSRRHTDQHHHSHHHQGSDALATTLALPPGMFQYKFIVDGHWKHNPKLPTQPDPSGNLNNVVTVVPTSAPPAPAPHSSSHHYPHHSHTYSHAHPPAAHPQQHPTHRQDAVLAASEAEYGADVVNGVIDEPQLKSPAESYNFSIFPQEDHNTEPPVLPRLLEISPLESDSKAGQDRCTQNLQQRSASGESGTDFVRLNHLFETKCDMAYGHDAAICTVAAQTRFGSKLVTTILIASNR